jgi:CheY-like chemotaxis protein
MITDDDQRLTGAVRAQEAVVRTLADELRRQRSRPDTPAGLDDQVREESKRLLTAMADRSNARSSQVPDESLATRGAPQSVGSRRRRVLVVEDEDSARNALASWFCGAYEVATARDGAEGFAVASTFAPDLIIADVWMPIMDGITMADQIRSIESMREVPVIFLTAHTSIESVAAGFSAGGLAYLTKPVDLELLEREVLAALEPLAE